METILVITGIVVFGLILFWLLHSKKRRAIEIKSFTESERLLLQEHVSFYNDLDNAKKTNFENRMQHFIATTRITGVNTEVEELDRVLIAASAIIPIFGFKNWEYMNLNEVLLYPGSFNEAFAQDGNGRNMLGVVGTGPYQNIMILSKQELRQSFIGNTGNSNTAIHEFVHLVDKTDGETDGIPELLLNKQYTLPWLNLMHQNIEDILSNNSDINPYGATNKAEFFAVVSEYFFKNPDLLQEKHPELYEVLTHIFRQKLK